MDGIIVINKPAGYTSHDCIAILRKITGERKIGHTGTLDPNATGVLPIALGKATRLIEYMDGGSKCYKAGVHFGITTDTQDIWGSELDNQFENLTEVLDTLSEDKIKKALIHFEGEINQIPPAYSAKSVNGKRAYDLARSGADVKLKPQKITIYNIELLSFNKSQHEAEFMVRCSRGTYVRTICHDLGQVLGCGACMSSLVRTEACGFTLDDALDFENLRKMEQSEILSHLLSIERAIGDMQRLSLSEGEKQFYSNGMTLKKDSSGYIQNKPVAVFYGEDLLGISEFIKDSLKPIKVFS